MIQAHRVVAQPSGSYPVFIGDGAVAHLDEIVDSLHPRGTRVLVTVPSIVRLHGERIAAIKAERIVIEDAEERKNLSTVDELLASLFAIPLRRDSLVIIAGGGMVGDAAGFAASIALRGVDFLHVPTTLLAQVDSSIGGKVGVNHPRGKNLIGAFAPPIAVVSDTAFLSTLPEQELRSGMFEALKSGVIANRELFDLVRAAGDGQASKRFAEIVKASVDVKASLVERDEHERGDRKLLNYGHTIGHAIETAAGYSGITHGEAVGWGMLAANHIAKKRGVLAASDAAVINEAIEALQPVPPPVRDIDQLVRACGLDKKFTSSSRVMVLPRRIGECVVEEVTEAEIRAGVEAMLTRRG